MYATLAPVSELDESIREQGPTQSRTERDGSFVEQSPQITPACDDSENWRISLEVRDLEPSGPDTLLATPRLAEIRTSGGFSTELRLNDVSLGTLN